MRNARSSEPSTAGSSSTTSTRISLHCRRRKLRLCGGGRQSRRSPRQVWPGNLKASEVALQAPGPTWSLLRALVLGLALVPLAASTLAGRTAFATVSGTLVDERRDALLELRLALVRLLGRDVTGLDLLVDPGGGFGDQRVDHLLLADVPILGHLGQRLAVTQLLAQLVGADTERLGGGLELRAVTAWSAAPGLALVDECRDAFLEIRLPLVGLVGGEITVLDLLVDVRGRVGHHGVDHGLHIDALFLCDLGDRLVALELRSQLVDAEVQRPGAGRRRAGRRPRR